MLETLSPPYDVVLADPPWSYYGAPDKWGAAAKFYPEVPPCRPVQRLHCASQPGLLR